MLENLNSFPKMKALVKKDMVEKINKFLDELPNKIELKERNLFFSEDLLEANIEMSLGLPNNIRWYYDFLDGKDMSLTIDKLYRGEIAEWFPLINGVKYKGFPSRKEAEIFGFEECFKKLEEKL